MNSVGLRKKALRCFLQINSSEWEGMWYTVKEYVSGEKRKQELDYYETERV